MLTTARIKRATLAHASAHYGAPLSPQVREARQAAEAACLSAAEAHTRARSAESAACQSASHHDRSLRYLADELESLNGLLAILYASADSARDSAR